MPLALPVEGQHTRETTVEELERRKRKEETNSRGGQRAERIPSLSHSLLLIDFRSVTPEILKKCAHAHTAARRGMRMHGTFRGRVRLSVESDYCVQEDAPVCGYLHEVPPIPVPPLVNFRSACLLASHQPLTQQQHTGQRAWALALPSFPSFSSVWGGTAPCAAPLRQISPPASSHTVFCALCAWPFWW